MDDDIQALIVEASPPGGDRPPLPERLAAYVRSYPDSEETVLTALSGAVSAGTLPASVAATCRAQVLEVSSRTRMRPPAPESTVLRPRSKATTAEAGQTAPVTQTTPAAQTAVTGTPAPIQLGAPLPVEVGPGTRLLNDRFELQERLGGGGMGVVYRALDLEAARFQDPNAQLAIKVVGEAIRAIPEATLALQRESSRARRLSHVNIVRVYEFHRDHGFCFITMELLRGKSWDLLLREQDQGLPFEQARPLIEQICNGLVHAHSQGVVHSDLKPGNVFLSDDGVVKILDFGIAAPVRRSAADGPETKFDPRKLGAISESYSCLEMWRGSPADPRDDLYSLGCVLYELLAGRHPFARASALDALERKLTPAPIKSLTREQNLALAGALELVRAERTGSVEAFATAMLRPVPARGRTGRATWIGVAISMASAAVLGTALFFAMPWLPPVRTPALTNKAQQGRLGSPTAAPQATPPAAVQPDTALSQPPAAPQNHLANDSVSEVERQCGRGLPPYLLTQAIQAGLAAKVRLDLAADLPARRTAFTQLRAEATCLHALANSGVSSRESEELRQESAAASEPTD